jgi:hypothetical protein
MNSKFKVMPVLIIAAMGFFIGDGARMGFAKTDPGSGCALLTPAQIQKVIGQPFDGPTETQLLPPFGEKWGSHCTYRSQKAGIAIDLFVYVTASPAQARQWFEMGAAVAKQKSKPSIGDSAYVDLADDSIHVLKSNVLYWIVINPGSEKRELDLAASVAARI